MMRRGRPPERFLATILFTDMVGSTDLAARLGDRDWRRIVATHHSIIRKVLRRFGGREIDTAGDGFFASFDQPAQALKAADAMLAEVASLGLTLRAGTHTGECEMIGSKVGGIAVHIAARVMATAEAGQVLASSTVRDLVAGSGLEFTDAGTHALKGVPGEWHLFALVRQALPAATADESTAATAAESQQAGSRRGLVAARIGVAVLAVLIAGLAGAAALGAFNQPPVAPPLEPGPDTVAVLERGSGKIVDVWSVQAGPVALELSGTRLWIAALEAGVLTNISTTGDGREQTTGRVGRPSALAAGDGKIWVADEFDKVVSLIDEATGDVTDSVEQVLARGIAFGSGSAWATDDLADRVLRLDRQSGAIAQTVQLDAGSYPNGIAFGNEAIWIGNVGSSTLVVIDPISASVVAAGISLGAVPGAIAAGQRDVWVAVRDNDQLKRVDPVSRSVSATIPVCDQPSALAVDGETVWIGCAGSGSHEVWHLDRDGVELSRTPVGGVPTDIVVGTDRVYVSVRES